jgi:hypothetical protein
VGSCDIASWQYFKVNEMAMNRTTRQGRGAMRLISVLTRAGSSDSVPTAAWGME